MALSIVENAKTSRPSVCNAAEVCLVHREIADAFLPKLKEILVDKRIAEGKMPVELRLDGQAAQNIISGTPASAEDFDTEFLDYILAIAVVDDVAAAAAHIAEHSTGHSESIIAQDPSATKAFVSFVDKRRRLCECFQQDLRMAGSSGSGVKWGFPLKSSMREDLWGLRSLHLINIESPETARFGENMGEKNSMKYQFGFIGTGNMGGALATAVCKRIGPQDVLLSDKAISKADKLADTLGCTVLDVLTVVESCRYIFSRR